MVRRFKTRKGEGRWRVVFKEGRWLCGFYRPEFRRREEIIKLEKHNAPELFLLLEGKITLVIKEEGRRIKEIEMKKGEIIVLDCWHNAYSRDGRGVALVVEREDIETEFMKIS